MTDRSATARLCPRCQTANGCSVAAATEPGLCWCREVHFGTTRWPSAPDRCLCRHCVDALAAAACQAKEDVRHEG